MAPHTKERLLQNIIKLCDGSIENQLKAVCQIQENYFSIINQQCIDITVIPKLLPIFLKWLTSENRKLQSKSIDFILMIVLTQNQKENRKNVVEMGALPLLANCLYSEKADTIVSLLKCLNAISIDYPEEVFNHHVLQPAISCIRKNENDSIVHEATVLLYNISTDCDQHIPHIIANNAVGLLTNLLKSKNNKMRRVALNTLVNIIACDLECCQHVLSHGALKHVKELVNIEAEGIKSLAIEFFYEVIKYNDEDQIDFIIDEGFIPLILKQIEFESSEIETYCYNVVHSLIQKRPSIVSSFIEKDIIRLICNTFHRTNTELLKAALSVLIDIIRSNGCGEKAEFVNYRCKQEIKKLRKQKIKEIEELLNTLNTLIADTDNEPLDEKKVKSETSEFDYHEENIEVVIVRNPRRIRNSVELPSNETKHRRFSQGQTDTEQPFQSDYSQDGFTSFINPAGRAFSQVNLPDVKPVANEMNIDTPSSPLPQNISTLPPAMTLDTDHVLPNNNNFPAFDYCFPPEKFLKNCCEHFKTKFDRTAYINLLGQIGFDRITPYSKPTNVLPANDPSGFSCFSIFFTGNEDNTDAVRKTINMKFTEEHLHSSDYDEDKLVEVIGRPFMLKNEHLKTIASWFNCRIMVYCNCTKWERYGAWNTDDENIPTFVLFKIENGYRIVLNIDEE